MEATGAVDAVMNQYFAALQAGDPASLKACFAPRARWIAPGRLRNSGTWTGPDAIVDEFFPLAMSHMQPGSFRTELVSLTTGPANAVVEWRSVATTIGGATYENDYIANFLVADGRISEVREYFDTQRGEVLFGG